MTNPIYACPHCREKIEVELTGRGQIRLMSPKIKETPE